MQIKRIERTFKSIQVYARKFAIQCLTLEDITLELENKKMQMQTKIFKSCKFYPNLTEIFIEFNFHQALFYQVNVIIQQLNQKGIHVVEKRCRELKIRNDHYYNLSINHNIYLNNFDELKESIICLKQ
ncbi:unnamed protein product [Paramecium sonneborni]|uniref:Uncharacterized protein n=1 Tax=Paramecium sonneborni TaxID=65129 RepID=A0A8S1P013_9CILI|nr:unnamed protein product [Paramecium sonneborni]